MSPKIIWKRELSNFSTCKRIVTGYCRQCSVGHIVQKKFLSLHQIHGDEVLVHWHDKEISQSQFESDREWLCGLLESSIRGNFGMNPLMKHEHSQDDIMVWIDSLNTCDKGGNKDIRIEELEDVITLPCNKNAPGGSQEFLKTTRQPSLNWHLFWKNFDPLAGHGSTWLQRPNP